MSRSATCARLAACTVLALLLGACASAPAVAPATAREPLTSTELAAIVGADFNGVVLVRTAAMAAPQVRAFGAANIEQPSATGPDTAFQIGSMSKWLTSVAVLRLVDRGVLQLDVPIGRWLPDMAASGATVTLRHLMSNTSGIPNGLTPALKRDPAAVMQPMSMARAASLFVGEAPAFTPGSKFDYLPTNWIVVGAILEQVTGKPFADVLADEVLRPAGARATGIPQVMFDKLPGAARAYGSTLPRQPKMTPHLGFVAASGTVYSTAPDLARLAHAVYETGLLSPSARAELSRVYVAEQSYALGGRVLTMQLGGKTRRVSSESGALGGYKSLLLHVAGEDATVVLLNNTDMDQSQLADMGKQLLDKLVR